MKSQKVIQIRDLGVESAKEEMQDFILKQKKDIKNAYKMKARLERRALNIEVYNINSSRSLIQ